MKNLFALFYTYDLEVIEDAKEGIVVALCGKPT
jgi:hypothetical protein